MLSFSLRAQHLADILSSKGLPAVCISGESKSVLRDKKKKGENIFSNLFWRKLESGIHMSFVESFRLWKDMVYGSNPLLIDWL